MNYVYKKNSKDTIIPKQIFLLITLILACHKFGDTFRVYFYRKLSLQPYQHISLNHCNI